MANDEFLTKSRDKWRELPAGGEMLERTFAGDFLRLDDESMLAHWRPMNKAACVPDVRGWFHQLYADTFKGKRVIEVGSGFGFDGIHFLAQGAHWTFSDLVADNLAVVKRIVDRLGLGERANYLEVKSERSYAELEGMFDAVWAIGALHHAPFEIARVETLDLLRHLKPGGRWIELYYPFERWQREGSLPFSEFGKSTDGPRTPWAEWYDLAKVRRRLFPARTETILDFATGGGNFGWADLRVEETGGGVAEASREVDLMGRPTTVVNGSFRRWWKGVRVALPKTLWWYGSAIDLTAAIDELGKPPVAGLGFAADLEVEVHKGAMGIVMTGDNLDEFVGREQLLDARPAVRRVTVESRAGETPARLLLRNASDGVAGRALIRSATLRFTA